MKKARFFGLYRVFISLFMDLYEVVWIYVCVWVDLDDLFLERYERMVLIASWYSVGYLEISSCVSMYLVCRLHLHLVSFPSILPPHVMVCR